MYLTHLGMLPKNYVSADYEYRVARVEVLPIRIVFAPQTIVKPQSGMAKSMSMVETKSNVPPK